MLTGDFDSLSDTAWQAHEREITPPNPASPAAHRALAPLGQRFQLPVLRDDRRAGGDVAEHSEFLASFFVCFLPILSCITRCWR